MVVAVVRQDHQVHQVDLAVLHPLPVARAVPVAVVVPEHRR